MAIPFDDLTISQWQDIKVQILRFTDSLLWQAMNARFAQLAASAQTTLDNPNSSDSTLRVAQGERKVARCARLVLRDLRRMADGKIPKGDS